MRSSVIFYLIGCVILFLGLLWMFLPHSYHAHIGDEILGANNAEEESHFLHTLEGSISAIIGIVLMEIGYRRSNLKNLTKADQNISNLQ